MSEKHPNSRLCAFAGKVQTRVQDAFGLHGGQTAADQKSERVLQRPVRVAHESRELARAEPEA